MIARVFLQARPGASALERAHVPQDGASGGGALHAVGHLGVVACKRRQEMARVLSARERLRDEAVHLHLAEIHLQADLAPENQQLSRNVLAGQILARIGLREPHPVRVAHERAERHAAVERVEQIAERPGQDALDPHDLVAAGDQIPQRRDHGQPRANVRLEQKVALAPVEHAHQRRVAAPRQRVRPFVRRDDVQVRLDERRIGVDDRRAGRAVDERDVRDVHLADPPRERLGVHPIGRRAQIVLPAGEIDPVRVGEKPLAVREPDDGDVEALREQVRPLLLQLTQDRAADVADADHRERQPLPGFEKSLVNRVERAHLLRRVDDARDVALRRALRDRADVDVLPPERVEHFPRHAGTALHSLADDRENRLIAPHVDLHRLRVELELELLPDCLDGARGVGAAHAEADRVLR